MNPHEYIHETLPDGIHTLIITCTAMWFQTREDEITEEGIVIEIIPFHLSISNISSRLLLKVLLLLFYSEDEEEYIIEKYDPTIMARMHMEEESELVELLTRQRYEHEKFEEVDYSCKQIEKNREIRCLKTYVFSAAQSYKSGRKSSERIFEKLYVEACRSFRGNGRTIGISNRNETSGDSVHQRDHRRCVQRSVSQFSEYYL